MSRWLKTFKLKVIISNKLNRPPSIDTVRKPHHRCQFRFPLGFAWVFPYVVFTLYKGSKRPRVETPSMNKPRLRTSYGPVKQVDTRYIPVLSRGRVPFILIPATIEKLLCCYPVGSVEFSVVLSLMRK